LPPWQTRRAGRFFRLSVKHLKVLERAALIERGRAAQWRPCRLQAAPLKEATDWLDQYRQFWEQSFNRLDDYLDKLKKD